MSETQSQLVRLLRAARQSSPQGLRAALRPVVKRVLPDELRSSVVKSQVFQADRWIGSRNTFRADGKIRHVFFVCGCYKSGTHWVQNILNLHPDVHVDGEFHFDILRDVGVHLTTVHWFRGNKPEYQETIQDVTEVAMRRMMYLGSRSKPDARWIGDRTPGPLSTVLRDAPQIFIVRDVRDVLISWSYHHLRIDNENGIAPHLRQVWKPMHEQFMRDPKSFDPLDGLLGYEPWLRMHAQQWAQINRQSRAYRDQLENNGTRVLELRYEEMHRDLPTQINRIYSFLNVDPELAEKPSHETRTLPGFATGNNPTSHYRSGKTEQWKGLLTTKICDIIKEEAGEELIAAGYEDNMDW